MKNAAVTIDTIMKFCIKCYKDIPADALYCPYCGKKQTSTAREKKKHTRANGSGSVYRRGRTWVACVTMGYKLIDGRRVQQRRTKGGFARAADAQAYLPTLQGLCGALEKRAPTIDDLWTIWRDGPMTKLSESKQTAYKIAYGKMQPIMNCRIDYLTIGDLEKVVRDNARTFYPARDMKNLLSQLYKRAMAEQYVSTNLSAFITLPELEEGEQTPFSEEAIRKFWADYSAGNLDSGYILLMIYTGMMPGELLGLKLSSIDLARKEIHGAGIKTKKRKQTPIVLADFMVPVVQALMDAASGELLLGKSKTDFYDNYHATLERLQIDYLPPYSCRHTTATALALGNIAPSVIQEVMRHAKITTTQHYIHIDTAPALAAVNTLRPPEEDESSPEDGTNTTKHEDTGGNKLPSYSLPSNFIIDISMQFFILSLFISCY